MKNVLSAVLFLFSFALSSQSITLNVLKKADAAFEQFSYFKALEYYKLALVSEKNNSYITSQIALSYKNLNEPDSAEVWFKKAIDLGEKDPEFNFFLAEALLSNQKREEAKYWYQEYDKLVGDDKRSAKKLEAIENFDQFFAKKDQVQIKPISDNSRGLDFSPAFYKDGLLFVSSRPKSGWVTQEFNWDESSFLDLYYFTNADSSATYLEDGLNTKYHEGPVVEYNNRKSIAYTRNNYDGRKLIKDQKGVTNLKLYFAEWDGENEKWKDEKPFQYNSDEYSVGSPAISQDGSVLIFSSNMPGGLGASDLYISHKSGEGWSTPENLGAQVNSKGRDGFPFLFDGLLYFSSEGREGLGGLDMYQIEFDGKRVEGEAENLGSPLNSNKDDFGLIRSGASGYFASNRNKATSDDIYRFYLNEPEMVLVYGDVYDIDSNTPLPLSDIFLEDESGELTYTRSGTLGKYQAYVPVNSSFVLSAGKYQYTLVDEIKVETAMDSAVTERIYLRKIPTLQPDTITIPEVTLVVDNRITPYEETTAFVDSFAVGDTVRFDIVYYDLDKSFLRPESKETLDKVATFMIAHVDVKAVLASHTDSRSSISYNKRLSQQRSNTSEDYLIFMGADPLKIQKVNYGEEKLANNCADGTDCEEDAHQSNRRTEILLIKTELY